MACLRAKWGECTPERKGDRNGFYTRDLMTTSGPSEDLNVPRDRAGQFHTQAFEQYRSSEPQVAEGLTQMFVAGTSTHKVGEVAQRLLGVAPSVSAVSRLNQTLQTLTPQFEAWRERPLPTHWRMVSLLKNRFKGGVLSKPPLSVVIHARERGKNSSRKTAASHRLSSDEVKLLSIP